MHEIIHLSFGTQSNHVHSHFYNSQASYFVFTKDSAKSSLVDPHVLFREGKGFTPRALIFDMSGGFGSMAKNSFMYEEESDSSGIVWNQTKDVEVIKQDKIAKSPYRQFIEGNQTGELNGNLQMNFSNTLYWSDYLNIVMHPKSLLTIPNWSYDPIKFPKGKHKSNTEENENFSNSSFSGFETGVDEFKDMNNDGEYLEGHFRPILEQCDSLSGLSISTDADTAWSGLTSSVLQEIRDDYFSKGAVFTWAFHDKTARTRSVYASRVKTTLDLASNSSLYIPLAISKSAHPESNWFNAGLYNLVFESYSVLSSLRNDQRISMEAIASSVSEGGARSIVDIVAAGVGSKEIYQFGEFSETKKSNHIFAANIIKRKAQKEPLPASFGGFNVSDIKDPWALVKASSGSINNREPFSKEKLTENGTPESLITIMDCPQYFPSHLSTFPQDIMTEVDDLHCTLQTSSGTREMAQNMTEFTKRAFKGDEKEELVEHLGNLAEKYRYGMDSEEEYE